MSRNSNHFSLINLFGFIINSFYVSLISGFKKGNKGWLLIEVIILILVNALIMIPIISIVPHLFGEDFISIDQVIQEINIPAFLKGPGRWLNFSLVDSKLFITLIYPIVIYICSRNFSNINQRILCFIGGYIGLISLFEIKYYYYFLSGISEAGEFYLPLSVSYYTLVFSIFILIISCISFARLSKAWLGILFTTIIFLGIALIYRIIGRNPQIYDWMILFSVVLLISTGYALNSFYSRNKLSHAIGAKQLSKSPAYDVFISYRRNVNIDAARLIRTTLNAKQIKTFLDVEDLGAKYFDERIIEIIKTSPNFILLLSPGDLDNCADENDWLRKEITTALQCNLTVIPVLKDGFEWAPNIDLPTDLLDLPRHNSIKYSQDYFEAVIIKIIDFIENSEM